MIARFSIYDLIAAVIPGIFFLWAVSYMSSSIDIPFTGGLAETSVLVALGYVTGLILQGISQGLTEKILLKAWGGFPSARWLLPDNNKFSNEYKSKIRQIVEDKYSLKADDEQSKEEQLKRNQEIFYLCYNAVDKEKLSDRPQIFNAHYGLFRCLLTTFTLLFLTELGLLLFGEPQKKSLVCSVLIFTIIGAVVSYFRTKKRGEDFAKSIYDLFLVRFSEQG
ncbi:MAG: hypothetical protein JRJ03_01405 [Deltaproteobacteria bacterium]|nr:hypothetical protein [Deltaproteobacteria bacterium]